MQYTASQIQDILDNLDAHITITDTWAAFDHDELWEASITISDEDGKTIYRAEDAVETEEFETMDEALKWMKDSIDHALSTELEDRVYDEDIIEGLGDDTPVILTTINPHSGWEIAGIGSYAKKMAADHYEGDDIDAEARRTNQITTTVRDAYERHEVPAAAMSLVAQEAEMYKAIYAVWTPAECEERFGLSDGTVTQAIRRGRLKAVRKSGGTWLIAAAEARRVWRDRVDLSKYDDDDAIVNNLRSFEQIKRDVSRQQLHDD